MSHSEARERVLHAAEQLFMQRGYTAVTIKDIAAAVGIHHASLYHHAPRGKQGLFVEVVQRVMLRHRDGLSAAVDRHPGDVRAQLRAVAAWLLAHPPVDLIRMGQSDAPALAAPVGDHLLMLAFEALLMPLVTVFNDAHARGEIVVGDVGNVAGAFLSAIQGLHTIPPAYRRRPLADMADDLVTLFIDGLRSGASA